MFQDFDVATDSLLPDVLKFPPNTDLHDHPLVLDGSIILQVSVYFGSAGAVIVVKIKAQALSVMGIMYLTLLCNWW